MGSHAFSRGLPMRLRGRDASECRTLAGCSLCHCHWRLPESQPRGKHGCGYESRGQESSRRKDCASQVMHCVPGMMPVGARAPLTPPTAVQLVAKQMGGAADEGRGAVRLDIQAAGRPSAGFLP